MERFISAIFKSLELQKLNLESDLEHTINESSLMCDKIREVERILGDIAIIDSKIQVWYSYVAGNKTEVGDNKEENNNK